MYASQEAIQPPFALAFFFVASGCIATHGFPMQAQPFLPPSAPRAPSQNSIATPLHPAPYVPQPAILPSVGPTGGVSSTGTTLLSALSLAGAGLLVGALLGRGSIRRGGQATSTHEGFLTSNGYDQRAERAHSPVIRGVGTDYLLRNGPKNVDPPAVNVAGASGSTHEVVYKKRPFGVARYAPGAGGKGAVVMEVTPKSRYPGDPQGQAFVSGVQPNWVLKTVNGIDVAGQPLEAIMEMLDDEVLDPVAALSLNLKESGVQSSFSDGKASAGAGSFSVKSDDVGMTQYALEKAEVPITVVYQEMR